MDLPNIVQYLAKCRENGIKKIFLTGQNTDPLMYKFLKEFIDYLQTNGFDVGIRTNGYLALDKINIINKCKGEIGYSINTMNAETSYKILGRHDMPDWYSIISSTTAPCRVSIVVNKYNCTEIEGLIDYLSGFKNINYIQLRRISTDTRYDEMKDDIEVFEELYENIVYLYGEPKSNYESAQIFKIMGKDIVFWRTVSTTANSMNYFTDGTISEEYFIIEGYLKNHKEGDAL
jgi:hypothetical protein